MEAITNCAYKHVIAGRKAGYLARRCIEQATEAVMQAHNCSRRKAALVTTEAWIDLEAASPCTAYIDVSHTTGNMVVLRDRSGTTSIFSVNELLQMRQQNPQNLTPINA